MGIKFGEVDVNQILENEFRIGVLERLLQSLMNRNPHLTLPTQEQIREIQKKVVNDLKKKYPNSGIDMKGGK